MRMNRLLGLGLVLLPLWSAAQPPTGRDSLFLRKTAANGYILQANNAPLASVLAEIADKTQVALHYTAASERRANLNCQGSIETILACALGSEANIVFRYTADADSARSQGQAKEVWILPTIPGPSQSQSTAETQSIAPADDVSVFLEQAKDPSQRMQAIANLSMEANKGNMQVRAALENALRDKNPGVRAQAVLALRQTDDEAALQQIQAATHDLNADVRLMAIESLGNNRLILQEALKDNDQNIRQYAATKLANLNINN